MKTALLAVTLLSFSSFAQEAVPPPPPPEPLQAQNPSTETGPTEGGVSASDEAESIRLRGGVTAGLGLFAPGPSFMFAFSGRVGVQLTRIIGVDFELATAAGLGIGVRTDSSGAAVSVTGAAYYQLAVLADFTFFDHLFIDVGPAVARGGWAGAEANASSTGGGSGSGTSYAVGGWLPGGVAKLGYMAGRRNVSTGQRHGFSISVDVNVLVGDRLTASGSGMTGGGSGSVSLGTGIGVGAMLMLGYAWR